MSDTDAQWLIDEITTELQVHLLLEKLFDPSEDDYVPSFWYNYMTR
jgi:hypothetical protein